MPYDEYRFTPYALNRHLVASGFADIEMKPLGGWDASLAQMIGLWVRRRRLNAWRRTILSHLLMPFFYLLYRLDRTDNDGFRESMMITGLWGTSYKAAEKTAG